MARRRVILYGRSVILGTVGVSLERYADLEIIPLSPPLPGAEELEALAPDVILFDVDAGRPEAAFTLLETWPNLLLVGVNPESDQIVLWSSSRGSALVTEDLVRVISPRVNPVNPQVRHEHETKDSLYVPNPKPAPQRPLTSGEAGSLADTQEEI
jgi:hypothetical protein